jgi:NTP pyrophosphatase (non-canonical NTP hydrolase)
MTTLDVAAIAARLKEFAAARDWEQYHSPKNLSTAIVVEAAELAEIFQWRTPGESVAEAFDLETRAHVDEEVADILIYLLRFADVVGVDVAMAVDRKIAINEERFPPLPPDRDEAGDARAGGS